MLGELSGKLGKPSSSRSDNLDTLSSAGGKEFGGFDNESVMVLKMLAHCS